MSAEQVLRRVPHREGITQLAELSIIPAGHGRYFYSEDGPSVIGLQFLALSLIANRQVDAEAGSAFAAPNIVHFGAVLGLSAILSAPWNGIGAVAVV
jgi:hypothetical protein